MNRNTIKPLRQRMAHLLGLAMVAGFAGLSTPSVLADGVAGALEAVPAAEKLIRIRESEPEYRGRRCLRVQLRTAKDSYREGEPIRFEVRGTEPFYLYLINTEVSTGRTVTILPNRLQTEHSLKYPGDDQWYTVPNPGLEFYGDRPGLERIVMIASERYLDQRQLFEVTHGRPAGDFYEMDSPLPAFDDLVTESYRDRPVAWVDRRDRDESYRERDRDRDRDIDRDRDRRPADPVDANYGDKGAADKAIRIRHSDQDSRMPCGVVMDEFNLRIR